MTPSHSIGAFITSSVDTTLRNTASGLLAAWRLALARMAAKVSSLVPYFCMCARPAPANWRMADGISGWPTSSSTTWAARSSAGARSSQRDLSAPGFICSKPNASAQSTAPLCTAWRARYRADEPVAQLLLTLTTGMPVMPTRYTAFWPQVESP
ncbi:hypothetical protein D3C85_1048900 [compost metagenome]